MLFGTKKNLIIAAMLTMTPSATAKETSIRGHRKLPVDLGNLAAGSNTNVNALNEDNLLDLQQDVNAEATILGNDVSTDLSVCVLLENGNYDLQVLALTDAQALINTNEAVLAGTGSLDINCVETVEDENTWICVQGEDGGPHELLQVSTLTIANTMVAAHTAVLALSNPVGGFYCTPRTVVEDPLNLHFEGFGYGDRGDDGAMVCVGRDNSVGSHELLQASSLIEASIMVENNEAVIALEKTGGGYYCVPHTIVNDPIDLHYEAFGEATRPEETGPDRGTTLDFGTAEEETAEVNLEFDASAEANRPAEVGDTSGAEGTGVRGDPHFSQWDSTKFDFHGQCDLVLIESSDFEAMGLKVHIRTKLEGWYSFVETVAIQIGDDVLEVQANYDDRKYWFNGQEGSTIGKLGGDMPFQVGGNEVRYHLMETYKSFQYKILLKSSTGKKSRLVIRSVKGNLRVEVTDPKEDDFALARGLTGSFPVSNTNNQSLKLGRDGATILEASDDFGQEWQVRPEVDGALFHAAEGPQYPNHCDMPSAASAKRRLLGDGSISMDAAVNACAHLSSGSERDDCVTDVIALGDLEIAGAY